MSERLTLRLIEPVQAHKAMATASRYPSGCGVYLMRCTENGRFYIGSSLNVMERLHRHVSMLRSGKHENPKVQNHFDKYGESSFVFEFIEKAERSDIHLLEQKWIDRYWGSNLLLNIQKVAGRPPKFDELSVDSQERKREKHRAQIRRPASQKHIETMRARKGPNNPNYGKPLSLERKMDMSERMSGEKNPGFGKTGELSPIYGLKRSAEVRAKMSEAQYFRAQQGFISPRAVACKRTELCGRVTFFQSAREASIKIGVGRGTVPRWCRAERVPADGSKWEYVG